MRYSLLIRICIVIGCSICSIATTNLLAQEEKPVQYDFGSIGDVDIDIREKAEKTPEDRSKDFLNETMNPTSKQWTPTNVHWVAPNITYQPLYFEDATLERYGQKHGKLAQAVFSTWDFTVNAYTLPLHMLYNRPRKQISPIGFARPGSVVPLTHENHFLK